MQRRPRSSTTRTPLLRAAALATGLIAVAGCATTQPADLDVGGADDALAIEIQNDVLPPRPLTVTLVPENGTARMIGIVSPAQTRTLTVDPEPAAGRFRLMAETTGGADIYSDPFTLGDVERVIWDLSPNSVRVIEEDGG